MSSAEASSLNGKQVINHIDILDLIQGVSLLQTLVVVLNGQVKSIQLQILKGLLILLYLLKLLLISAHDHLPDLAILAGDLPLFFEQSKLAGKAPEQEIADVANSSSLDLLDLVDDLRHLLALNQG